MQSPMLSAASPDARLVSPWLGGSTPRSAASPWDNVSPSPAPVCASSSSKGSSYSRSSGRTHQLTFSSTSVSNGQPTGLTNLAKQCRDYSRCPESSLKHPEGRRREPSPEAFGGSPKGASARSLRRVSRGVQEVLRR